MPNETLQRKDSHLDLVAHRDVESDGVGALFDCVHLVHEALPELADSEIQTSTTFMGKTLRYPLIVTGMTGGTDRAREVNRDLAGAAERAGVAFGVGSQRAMSERPDRADTFRVRGAAPTALVLGNIGLAQARSMGPPQLRELMEAIGADGLAIHLNAGQEMVQPEGERDFRGGEAAIAALARTFGDRLVVKETGCGISPILAKRLCDAGVRHIDVSGSGGTSWVKVESLRAKGAAAKLGEEFSNWGIPTAACLLGAASLLGGRATLIASGGIRGGLDAARALCLGADLVGIALPIFRAQQAEGADGAFHCLEEVSAGIRLAMLLTGSRTLMDLRRARRVLDEPLERWVSAISG
jgi:isopentenyl-diphosphate Delta-isomerase